MFRCYFFLSVSVSLIRARSLLFLFAFESCPDGNVRRAMGKRKSVFYSHCVCVCARTSGLSYSLFSSRFAVSRITKASEQSTPKAPRVHCTEVYALYCGDSQFFYWLKRVSHSKLCVCMCVDMNCATLSSFVCSLTCFVCFVRFVRFNANGIDS